MAGGHGDELGAGGGEAVVPDANRSVVSREMAVLI